MTDTMRPIANSPPARPLAEAPARPQRAWQRMLSGRRLDLLAPAPSDIAIEDIAHGLARVARWNGQTVGSHAFSVAQHALLVTDIAVDRDPGLARHWQLAALLHDAAEYVIGDLISPFKTAIGLDYRTFEGRLMQAIHRAFALPPELPPEITRAIKDADRIAAFFEATRLAGFTEAEAQVYFGDPEGLSAPLTQTLASLEAWAAPLAQTRFLDRHASLIG